MARSVFTALMYEGAAEEAMNFYISLFKGSEITRIERYGAGEPGAEGSIKIATLKLAGHDLICFDSPVKHAFTFTRRSRYSSSAGARPSWMRRSNNFQPAGRL